MIEENEEWCYDEFGGCYIINHQEGSRFYLIDGEVYIDREEYLKESRDIKLKQIGI